MFSRRRPNVSNLARKGRIDDLIQALGYKDWTQLRNGEYLDAGTVVRGDAVEALAGSEDPRVIEATAEYSLQDSSIRVQLAAVRSLRSRLGVSPTGPLAASSMARAFAIPADRNNAVREALADALESSPALTAAPVARALIDREDERPLDDTEHRLLRGLVARGENVAELLVREFVVALGHDRVSAQERAVQAMRALAPRSIPSLIDAMRDQQLSGRAAEALGRCGDGRAVAPLIEMLHDENPSLRQHAARALGGLRDPRSAEPLFALAQDDSYEVRVAATSALDALGSLGVIVSLATMLRPLVEGRGGRVHLDAAAPAAGVSVRLEAPSDVQPSRDIWRISAGPDVEPIAAPRRRLRNASPSWRRVAKTLREAFGRSDGYPPTTTSSSRTSSRA